jgi:hypothetical protein
MAHSLQTVRGVNADLEACVRMLDHLSATAAAPPHDGHRQQSSTTSSSSASSRPAPRKRKGG